MQIGMIGLGRMGANMVRRLRAGGHECVVFDRSAEAVQELADAHATPAESIEALVGLLKAPRAIWMMVPHGAVDQLVADLTPHLAPGDILIDGGNSHYAQDVRIAGELAAGQIHYVDCGTSGGVWGLERGYCLMIGGPDEAVRHLDPIFRTLAPGTGDIPRTAGRESLDGPAEQGYLHCGPSGAGHFVKMVHNGIEYGLMAAYAEGMNLLAHGDTFQFNLNVRDIAEVWRRGSVISSWLLDLTATALVKDPRLDQLQGRVSDSGEGRWTVQAAVDAAVPVPVLSAALFSRFSSRGEGEFGNKVLSAMRFEFGGHVENK